MPLLKCPECKRMVSSLIDYCPFCGYPINVELRENLTKKNILKQAKLLSNNGEIQLYSFIFILLYNHCDVFDDEVINDYLNLFELEKISIVRYFSGLKITSLEIVKNEINDLNKSSSLETSKMYSFIFFSIKNDINFRNKINEISQIFLFDEDSVSDEESDSVSNEEIDDSNIYDELEDEESESVEDCIEEYEEPEPEYEEPEPAEDYAAEYEEPEPEYEEPEDVSADYGYLEDEPELLVDNLNKLYGN